MPIDYYETEPPSSKAIQEEENPPLPSSIKDIADLNDDVEGELLVGTGEKRSLSSGNYDPYEGNSARKMSRNNYQSNIANRDDDLLVADRSDYIEKRSDMSGRRRSGEDLGGDLSEEGSGRSNWDYLKYGGIGVCLIYGCYYYYTSKPKSEDDGELRLRELRLELRLE